MQAPGCYRFYPLSRDRAQGSHSPGGKVEGLTPTPRPSSLRGLSGDPPCAASSSAAHQDAEPGSDRFRLNLRSHSSCFHVETEMQLSRIHLLVYLVSKKSKCEARVSAVSCHLPVASLSEQPRHEGRAREPGWVVLPKVGCPLSSGLSLDGGRGVFHFSLIWGGRGR